MPPPHFHVDKPDIFIWGYMSMFLPQEEKVRKPVPDPPKES